MPRLSPIRPVDKYLPNGDVELVLMDDEEELAEIFSSPDTRRCKEIHVFSQKLETVRKVFEIYGSEVTKLYWSNSGDLKITAKEVVDALNLLPKLESMILKHFEGIDGVEDGVELKLENLKEIELESDEKVLKFYSKVLPENSIKVMKVDLNESFKEFFEKQKNVKVLNISNFEKVEVEKFSFIKNLKLEKLICHFSIGYQEDPEPTRNFANFLIESQPNLKVLELYKDSDYSNKLVDDKIFEKICELSELEELSVAIDEISSIKSIEKLKNLRNLSLKTTYDRSLKLFDELSKIKIESIRTLTLNLWSFEIPADTYESLAENLPNLKSLKITLGTRHKINFYAKVFKNLESLSIRFGEANNHLSMADAFEFDTEILNESLKKISLTFTGSGSGSDEELSGILGLFPNLEVVKVSAEFKVSSELFVKLSQNLGKIKELKLSTFKIKSDEEFTPKLIETLKELSPKLKFLLIIFMNQKFRREPEMNFDALTGGLEGVYNISQHGYTTCCTNTIVEIFKCERGK